MKKLNISFGWKYISRTFLRNKYTSHTWNALFQKACIATLRDVCRSNRLYNERVQPVDGKYWMNISSIVLRHWKGESRQFVRVRWRNSQSLRCWRGYTNPSRFNAKQAYSGEISSAPDTDSRNINLMIESSTFVHAITESNFSPERNFTRISLM